MQLIEQVKRAEELCPKFNHEPMSVDDCYEWASSLGVEIKEMPELESAFAVGVAGHYVIGVPSRQDPVQKVMSIAHEMGHIMLGHIPKEESCIMHYTSPQYMFLADSREQAANVFALNAVIPTTLLFKLFKEMRLNVIDLFKQVYHYWPDDKHHIAFRVCRERLDVFHHIAQICGLRCQFGEKCRYGKNCNPE